MIRIHKSPKIPLILSTKGASEVKTLKLLYDSSPNDYDTGLKKFKFKSTIYGDKAVKNRLIKEQHGKCCFCESLFLANSFGDVEHFRPKGGYYANRYVKIVRPGYYWLAYDWNNLMFSCEICNRRYKKNFFPLVKEADRAKNHSYDYDKENNSIINPLHDDPEKHISFNRHVVQHLDAKGKNSITAYGLRRRELNKRREAALQAARQNKALASVDLNTITTSQKNAYSVTMKLTWVEVEELILIAKEFMKNIKSKGTAYALMMECNKI